MKLGILTSSRADFGIYQPLLNILQQDDRFDLEIIAFGTHLSPYHGYTLDNIKSAGFRKIKKVYGMPLADTAEAIANAYGLLVSNFSQFWASNTYDWVLALGDRFEMAAAVQAGIPLEVNFAHLHGGETTLGAIDNIYRHQITLASSIHLVATMEFKIRVTQILGSDKHIYWVGALSLDDIEDIILPSWEQVAAQFKILNDSFVLVTFHPETVMYKQNKDFSQVTYETLSQLIENFHLLVTMPNTDTASSLFRNQFVKLQREHPERVSLIENFGRLNYFSAMKASHFLLGNTSSGIIEAASFGKYVVNVGDRQKGRPQSKNVLNVPFDKDSIIHACIQVASFAPFEGENIYFKPDTANTILDILSSAKF